MFAFYAANKLGAAVNLVHPFLPARKAEGRARKNRTASSSSYTIYTPAAGFAFGIPVLVSDSASYMGAGAKLYYRFTQKRKAKGIPFEKYLKNRGNPRIGAGVVRREGTGGPTLPAAAPRANRKPSPIANAVCNNLCAKAQEFLGEPIENYTALYNVLPIFQRLRAVHQHAHVHDHAANQRDVPQIQREAQREGNCPKPREHLDGRPHDVPQTARRKGVYARPICPTSRTSGSGATAFCRGSSPISTRYWSGRERARASSRATASTETAGVCVVNTRQHNRAGSVGRPLTGTEVGIYKDGVRQGAGQVGEIYLHSEQFMLGYLGEEGDPFVEADGKKWLATGDCGYVDEDGFLFFKQRLKNVLKVSGVPVYPSEIEEAAGQAKGVAKCCAVGVPDPVKGQIVRLYVEPEEGTDRAACEREVMEICRRRLIGYRRAEASRVPG